MKNDRYMKVIEILGEVLIQKDEDIQFKAYEVEALKRKIEKLKQQVNKNVL